MPKRGRPALKRWPLLVRRRAMARRFRIRLAHVGAVHRVRVAMRPWIVVNAGLRVDPNDEVERATGFRLRFGGELAGARGGGGGLWRGSGGRRGGGRRRGHPPGPRLGGRLFAPRLASRKIVLPALALRRSVGLGLRPIRLTLLVDAAAGRRRRRGGGRSGRGGRRSGGRRRRGDGLLRLAVLKELRPRFPVGRAVGLGLLVLVRADLHHALSVCPWAERGDRQRDRGRRRPLRHRNSHRPPPVRPTGLSPSLIHESLPR